MKKFGLLAGLLIALIAGASSFAQQAEKSIEQILEENNRKMEALMKRIEELETVQEQEVLKSAESAQKVQKVEEKLADPEMFKEVEEARVARLVREELEKNNSMRVFWNKGPVFETADKSFTAKLGGRVMVDWTWRGENQAMRDLVGSGGDGVRFRRIRLEASGTVHDNWKYAAQFDFSGGNTSLKDAYIRYTGLPFDVTVGHMKEPFGLEELTSSKYITFIERSTAASAFSPSHNMGIMASGNINKRATWAVGAFRETDGTGFELNDGGSNLTARVTALPWYAEDGKRVLHLGASASRRSFRNYDARYRSRPGTSIGARVVDTGAFDANRANQFGTEVALVYGPASLQAEYMRANVSRSGAANPSFDGYYVQASYFLTGEHRPYSTSKGTFGRVTPKNNFSLKEGGWGAWEVAARYSNLDLDGAGINGGDMDLATLGLNWHINNVTRIMFNYSRANVDRGPINNAKADIFQTRFQIDF